MCIEQQLEELRAELSNCDDAVERAAIAAEMALVKTRTAAQGNHA